jgi:ketosteroid isomerase-like protein
MSQENVEIVRQIYQAFAAGGVEAALPFLAPNGALYPFPEWPGPSEYRGRDGLRRLLAEWTENFDDFEFESHEIRAVGDRVLVLAEMVGRIKGSGVPIRQPLGAIYGDFRDGEIGEGRFFNTWREALKAAGL